VTTGVARSDIVFDSAGARCAGWLYLPAGPPPHPVVVMAHGFGGQRRFRLDAFAERFAAAGLAAVVFDYRYFGDSEGEPRQLIDVGRQLEDWRSALAFTRGHHLLDATRLALWGTSFSGGHVLSIAARDHDVAAVVTQVPFVDGRTVARSVPMGEGIRCMTAAVRDRIGSALGRPAHRVALFGPPGTVGAMTAPGAEEAIRANLLPPGEWDETTPARVFLALPRYRPGRLAGAVECPVLFVIADNDNLTPPDVALAAAQRAPRAEVVRYPVGHFAIYAGDPFEQAVADEVAFLRKHLAQDGSGP